MAAIFGQLDGLDWFKFIHFVVRRTLVATASQVLFCIANYLFRQYVSSFIDREYDVNSVFRHDASIVFCVCVNAMYKSTVLGTISSYFRVCIFRTSNERCKTFEVRPLTDCYLFLNRRYKFINYMFYLPYGTKTPWFYRLINKLLGFKVPFCSFV